MMPDTAFRQSTTRWTLFVAVAACVLAACTAQDQSGSGQRGGDRWIVAFSGPSDTLYLDTASILRVGEGRYRAWFRSTRTGKLVREETDCTQMRSRSLVMSDSNDLTAVAPADDSPWEELPPGSRGEAYARTLCRIAPRRGR